MQVLSCSTVLLVQVPNGGDAPTTVVVSRETQFGESGRIVCAGNPMLGTDPNDNIMRNIIEES